MTAIPLAPPRRLIELEVDGTSVRVPEGSNPPPRASATAAAQGTIPGPIRPRPKPFTSL
jgi:hypothetical protein